MSNTTYDGTGGVPTGVKLLEQNIDYSIVVDAEFNVKTINTNGNVGIIECMEPTSPWWGLKIQSTKTGVETSKLEVIAYGQYSTEKFDVSGDVRLRAVITHVAGTNTVSFKMTVGNEVKTGSCGSSIKSITREYYAVGYNFIGTMNLSKLYSRVLTADEIDGYLA